MLNHCFARRQMLIGSVRKKSDLFRTLPISIWRRDISSRPLGRRRASADAP